MTLKEARLAAGLTQAKMAEIMLIPKRSIENWEGGKSKCPEYVERLIIAELQRIAEKKGDADMKKYTYFCATCGRRFESDLPYKDENGLESDVSCPHCGDFNVYPDTEDGHKREQKAFNNYENAVKAWEE